MEPFFLLASCYLATGEAKFPKTAVPTILEKGFQKIKGRLCIKYNSTSVFDTQTLSCLCFFRPVLIQ